MKSKNGFTLIELLAVIVILAIIALIATPIVLNLINKAREGAAKDSAYGIRKAGQLYFQTLLLDDVTANTDNIEVSFNNGVITVSPENEEVTFALDGNVPSDGSINISTDGKVSGAVIINGYTCIIPETGEVVCGGTSNKPFTASEIVYNNSSYTNGNVNVQSVVEDLYIKLDF